MNAPTKLGAFLVALAVVFVAAQGVGRIAGPAPVATGHADAGGHHDREGDHDPAGSASNAAGLPGGLQMAQDGFRLVPVSRRLATDSPTEFAFRIIGPDGRAVTRYVATHDKDLHLIVVGRDLSGFQHLHPRLGPDGTWSVPLRVNRPGPYRIFTDFQPAGRDRGLTLGVDLPAPGDYRPLPLPEPARTATVDGYTVTLTGDLVPGTASRLTLEISRDGRPVTDLQPYLAAYGHLVALRDGDLAYLHVHPHGSPGDGRTAAGPAIAFSAEVPSAGTYRLYLDFQHAGTARTAEFTVTTGGTAPPTGATADPAPAGTGTTTPAPAHGSPSHTHEEGR